MLPSSPPTTINLTVTAVSPPPRTGLRSRQTAKHEGCAECATPISKCGKAGSSAVLVLERIHCGFCR